MQRLSVFSVLSFLITLLFTSCYSYNPIYERDSNFSLSPKLENYETEVSVNKFYKPITDSQELEKFIISDINRNVITKNEFQEPIGKLNIELDYDYGEIADIENIHFMLLGIPTILGFPWSTGVLWLTADIEITNLNGDLMYYQSFKKRVKWKKSLYFKSHSSASISGINKRVKKNMVYKGIHDVLTSFKMSLTKEYTLDPIDSEILTNIDLDIKTSDSKANTENIPQNIDFEISDSTFYINSIAVIPKEIKACDGSVSSADELASYTETNILSHYNVTDRRHLEAILEEHRLQMSGLTLEKTLLESGCIENAQAYLFVREGCLKGDEIIELRLVHCETSTLVWSCVGKNASIDEILGRIDEELSKD